MALPHAKYFADDKLKQAFMFGLTRMGVEDVKQHHWTAFKATSEKVNGRTQIARRSIIVPEPTTADRGGH